MIKAWIKALCTPANTCPNGHMSTMQRTDGTNVCLDCGATW